MRVLSLISSLLLLSTWGITSSLKLSPVMAGERSDGTVFFEAPPKIDQVRTTFDEVQMRGATYYFTLTLPPDAEEPLAKLLIEQRGGIDEITLLLDQTIAFIGTPKEQQERPPLSLANVAQSEDKREITAEFATPIPPGTTVTVGLKPRKNPQYDGVYLFGVTAFPAGETVQELYLGVRRLHFYDRRNDSDFRMFP